MTYESHNGLILKILAGLFIAMSMGSWGMLYTMIQSARGEIKEIAGVQQGRGERIKALEQQMVTSEPRLSRIEAKLDQINEAVVTIRMEMARKR